MYSVTGKHRQADCMNEAPITDQASLDQSSCGLLFESYRHELLLHCYRLLGSLHDAEDAVQETMLRAWRHFDTFTQKGPGSLRAWLYKIATNTSLDLLKKRLPRTLPTAATPPWDPDRPVAKREAEELWLEPFPNSWLAEATENPEARYTRGESVSLAFLTALQLLPPRQRAILLLSDVLDWRAVEIAQLLEISGGAVNSALHRARVTLEKNYPSLQREMAQVDRVDAATKMLLTRYLQAWETGDVNGLVALLKEDATLSMPPIPSWYQGREAIRTFFRAVLFPSGVQNRWRLSPTRANGQPAFVVYRADEATRAYRAFALQVVTLDATLSDLPQVASVTAFLEPELVTSFGFPLQLCQ
ncbi:sigma-70 family RNA polymerase sigma factor [Ktedonosporobacter rubrisoli]|uniref:Sigma-70 family RNA polymerase sigma factor n=1 Tax=Ktedonosporobacter rubrisoli TaxID=2509675 RepID=A0A4P6JKI0_KTERU|nr:sigma-70 family RNA polymerase sigma factor [Ktedonosporobacter rubrisoli]QBD75156.1 sigma-70 family RNA polymerase sigma factor [Ktedonosporobacter rubrisoli]